MIAPISLDNSLTSYRYPGRYGCYANINAMDADQAMVMVNKMLQTDNLNSELLEYWDNTNQAWSKLS